MFKPPMLGLTQEQLLRFQHIAIRMSTQGGTDAEQEMMALIMDIQRQAVETTRDAMLGSILPDLKSINRR